MTSAKPTSLLVLLCACSLAACVSAAPREPEPAAAEALIGPEGGRLGTDGIEVTIPAGAVEEAQVLRVVPAAAPPDALGPLTAAYDVEPAGLELAVPATVRFPGSAATPGASVFLRRREGEPFVAVPTRVAGSELVAELGTTGRAFVGAACQGEGCCTTPRSKLDLLLVIDDSNSMAEEQAALREQIPRVVRAIATGDLDGDGVQEHPAVDSLHVGVVTTDLGGGGYPVPTCDTASGDDARLRIEGAAVPGCDATYAPWQDLSLGDDPEPLVHAVSCVALAGVGGCGFEQPLEAALQALTPSSAGLEFGMRAPQGDAANAGFLRDDAVLAIVILSDENDASVRDGSLMDPTSSVYEGELNLRAFLHPDALQPVSRYIDGLRALKADAADVVFAVIAGIPTELAASGADLDAILADPRMSERIDPSGPMLTPSCNSPGRGIAFPPRRLVETAAGFGANGIVASICQDDLAPAASAISARLGRRLAGACGD